MPKSLAVAVAIKHPYSHNLVKNRTGSGACVRFYYTSRDEAPSSCQFSNWEGNPTENPG